MAPYDPRYYTPTSYLTEDSAGFAGALLAGRLSTVWALDLYLDSGFPITFPWSFSAVPLRVSSVDVYPDLTVLGDQLYEARILDAPTVTVESLDVYGAVRAGETVRVRLTAKPRDGGTDLHAWVAGEHRGKRVDGWLLDIDAEPFIAYDATLAFRGEIITMADDPSSVDVLIRIADVYSLTETLPAVRVDATWAPYAPAAGRGQLVPEGIGYGRRIPLRPVRARTADDTEVALTCTANTSTDALTIADGHDWLTGDGPVRISSTGTPPAPLVRGTDYFVVALDDVTVRLALTRADANAGTTIDLTSTGSGTHQLVSGLPPNYDEATDLAVGRGNIGVMRLWVDGDTESPAWPLNYAIETRRYRAGGRYLTSVRYQDDLSETSVEADVLRVYPDADEGVVGEWKWLRGFQDDSGNERHVLPSHSDGPTTGDLTGFGHLPDVGGVAMVASRWLNLPDASVWRLQSFTIELHYLPGLSATFTTRYPYLSPGHTTVNSGVHIRWDAPQQRARITINHTSGSATQYTGGDGSWPRGVKKWVVVRRDAASGRDDILIDGVQVATATNAAPVRYDLDADGAVLAGGGDGSVLGYVRISNVYRTDAELATTQWLWRRNGMQLARELIASAGRRADPTTFDQAAADWHAVEAGGLRCDGWITEQTDLRAVLLALAPMRGVRFGVDQPTHAITATIPTASTSVTAAFGHGDQIGNMAELPTRVRASLTEAVKDLIVRFRQTRTQRANGADYDREVRRSVFPAGGADRELVLPFVDDPQVADLVADWTAKRLVARDQLLTVATGRDGRAAQIGQRVTVDVPGMGISWDAEVVGLDRSTLRHDLRVVPWSASAFTYTPKPLPPDPADVLFEPLSLGATPTLVASYGNGRVRLEVIPANTAILRPYTPGSSIGVGWDTVVGGGTSMEAIDDVTPDDDTSYFGTPPNGAYATYRHGPLTVAGSIARVQITARLKQVGGTVAIALPAYRRAGWPGSPSPVSIATYWSLGTSYATYTAMVGGPDAGWSAATVNDADFGVQAFLYGDATQIRLTQLYVSVLVRQDVLRGGFVRYWRAGPSASQPATPTEADDAHLAAEDLGVQVDDVSGSGGDTFWYWARVYDARGRQIALLGPASVTL